MPLVRKVVIVLLDALPLDALGCYGGFRESTPGFDRLAATGAVFENALAVKIASQESGFGEQGSWTGPWHRCASHLETQGVSVREVVCTTLNKLSEAVSADAVSEFLADPASGVFVITGPELVPPPVHGHLAVVDQAIAALHTAVERAASSETLLAVAALQGSPSESANFPQLTAQAINVPLLIWTPAAVVPGLRVRGLVTTTDLLATSLVWLSLPSVPEVDAEDLAPLLRCEVDAVRQELLIQGPGEIGLRTADRYAVLALSRGGREPESGQPAGLESSEESPSADPLDGAVFEGASRVAVFQKPGDVWDRLDVGNTMPEERDALERRARQLFADRGQQ